MLVLVTFFMLLKSSKVQMAAVHVLTTQLSRQLQTTVAIRSVDYELFNKLNISDIYIEDRSQDTLLYVDNLVAHFDFWAFFHRNISFYRADVNGLSLNLSVDEMGENNFAFIIDALKRSQKKPFSVTVEVDEVYLNNASLRFRKANADVRSASSFSPDDVFVTDLNARLALRCLSPDSLDAQITSLSFREQSGFVLSDLQAHLLADKTAAYMPVLRLCLPNSSVVADEVHITYDSLAALANLISEVHWDVPIKQAQIAFSDFAAFVPEFKNMVNAANVSAHVKGTVDNLKVDALKVGYNGRPLFQGDVSLNGLPVLTETFVYASVTNMSLTKYLVQDFVSDLQNRPFILPDWFNQLGNIRYSGVLSGFLSNLVAYGTFVTRLGAVSTDILLQTDSTFRNLCFNGAVKTNRFQLGTLLNHTDVGNIAFQVQVSGKQTPEEPLNGNILAVVKSFGFRDYQYRDIHIDGEYNVGGFDGRLSVDDENLACQFEGLVDLTQDLPVLNFELGIDRIHFQELHLTDRLPDADLAFHTSINCVGNSLDNLNGYLLLDSLRFRNGTKLFELGRLLLHSDVSDTQSSFTIQSPYVNAGFSGKYRYSTLSITVKKIIARYLPTLIPEADRKKLMQQNSDNEMEFYAYLKNIDLLCDVFNLPITIGGMPTLKGFVNEQKEQCAIQFVVPTITTKQLKLDDFTLNCDNRDNRLNLSAYVQQGVNEHRMVCLGKIVGNNDSVYINMNWGNKATVRSEGTLQAMAHISQYAGKPLIDLTILPTQVMIADSVFDVSKSHIVYTAADTTLQINDFRFGSSNQYIYVDGLASRFPEDSIHVRMKDLELGYIIALTPVSEEITFGGRATGTGTVYGLLKQPMFEASAFLKDARINNASVGDAVATATWNRKNKTIDIHGKVAVGTDTVADIIGLVEPKLKKWDLWIAANGVDIKFLNRWMEVVAQDVTGYAYGNVHVYGQEKKTWVEGKALAKDAGLSIDMLGTRYFFSDSITIHKDAILMKNIEIHDADGHKAILNGSITHNGLFKQLKYVVDIDCHNMMAMNTTITENDFFFGKVYATGKVHIEGNEADCRIRVNARSDPNTNFNISLGYSEVASDNSFITFVDHKAPPKTGNKTESAVPSTRIRLKMQIDATPDAVIQVIIDPKTGDVLTGRGAGNLTLDYDTNGDIKLFGTYTLESGSYMFTLQNFIRKEFKINQGSNLMWTGDPFNAQVDIKGMYSLTASLRDLMGTEIKQLSTNRTSIPVNCILLLSGNLMNPNIKFDIDLPNSDDGVKQQVNTIINTDEMMMRQIIYLLVFNKFYTPEYLQASTSTAGSGEAYSLLSSTVTGQINNWISKLTKDFTLGFNVRTSGEGDDASQEYETQFLYQPNNRLIINGNLGYRNDDISDRPIFGDVDVEYLLTPSGKFRAKAYTHTVDKYSLKEAQTVQGVGLMYKEDFNTVGELLNNYWNDMKSMFTRRKDKKKTEEKQTTENDNTTEKADTLKTSETSDK